MQPLSVRFEAALELPIDRFFRRLCRRVFPSIPVRQPPLEDRKEPGSLRSALLVRVARGKAGQQRFLNEVLGDIARPHAPIGVAKQRIAVPINPLTRVECSFSWHASTGSSLAPLRMNS